jgi:hypothetical protein
MLDSYQIAFLFPEQWLIPVTLKNYIYVLKDRETLVGPIGHHFPTTADGGGRLINRPFWYLSSLRVRVSIARCW